MLIGNNIGPSARTLSGINAGYAQSDGRCSRHRIANAMAFGDDTSWPQGYQSILRGLTPPLKDSGQMAVRLGLALDLDADLIGLANAEASFAVDLDMTADANARINTTASFAIDVDVTAALRATGNMSATFDLVGRPSAVDIAQEVWNGFNVEAGLSGAEVMRILLAVAAGKTAVAAGPPVVVTFRDQDDTKDRVRAEMTDSERDAVTVDGSA